MANVSVPLLCISALDDPLCTKEAIPLDECRANKNVVLATTPHGGHLAFYEGMTADRLWWAKAVDEFLSVLHAGPFMHKQKKTQDSGLYSSFESSIDKGPYVNITEDGMVMALANERTNEQDPVEISDDQIIPDKVTENPVENIDQSKHKEAASEHCIHGIVQSSKQNSDGNCNSRDLQEITAPVKKYIHQLSRANRRSMWLLTYIAIVTTWPLIGSALLVVFKRKLQNVLPAAWLRR